MATTVTPFAGTYQLDPAHSTVQFAVRHQQLATFRASFRDVHARLTADGDAISLEGQARVDSVSIGEPAEFREHVVRGADFFDADRHPLITFRSTRVELRDDGSAAVSGELAMRGATRAISARGTYQPPRKDPFGNCRAGLELEATIDRRAWKMDWQMALPDGSDALGWDVQITVDLELIRAER